LSAILNIQEISSSRFDNGAMGIGQVIEKHQKKNFMKIVFYTIALRLVNELDSDIFFWVEQGNAVPEKMLNRKGICDVLRKIIVTNKPKSSL
jgi:hypothetical protein